ncbi:bidirectional sugar transporter SWEET14 [Vitis vinifera]|uniref:Bidirectional sugar transporter SWEET n=2 Tax=Vitis vinifera TaxID=29760 RepID=F6HQ15_VITVI|nr:bidirectional sugar transporter SWEET14 [Vitis vinifera]|eukprot:XP_002270131.1 PREDICTED: bidirectional sugar transporter SWEET14 [Vitis vinifera]
MAMLTVPHMAFAFGILGNIVSFLVYLSPLPTFYRIYKRKSTEGFQSIPYSVALFSAMLLLYYAFLKTDNQIMLITINSVGTCIEATYLLVYMIYAPRTAKIYTAKLLLLFNTGVYGAIVLSTFFLSKGHRRAKIVGWVCAAFSLCVFAAPLSIMRLVIRTKSVEYMPFPLSFFLTICAVMWFFYGLLIRDFYIAFPNILGFAFGIAQMILYTIYKNAKKGVLAEFKLQELPNGLVFPTLKKAENTDTNPNDQPEDTAMTEGGARDKAVEPSGELKV